jgi:hypothetical protein
MKNYIALLLTIITGSSGLFAQDTLSNGAKNKGIKNNDTKYYQQQMIINGLPDEVFTFMDDIRNTGKHMTDNSGAMAGSKLKIEWLSDNKTGLGTNYRWMGTVMGMKMDFTVEVSKWVEGKEKVWGTVGNAKMIVIDWFEMHLEMMPDNGVKSKAKLSIKYTKHKGFLGFLLSKAYSKWCVKSMLKDTRKHFNKIEHDK